MFLAKLTKIYRYRRMPLQTKVASHDLLYQIQLTFKMNREVLINIYDSQADAKCHMRRNWGISLVVSILTAQDSIAIESIEKPYFSLIKVCLEDLDKPVKCWENIDEVKVGTLKCHLEGRRDPHITPESPCQK